MRKVSRSMLAVVAALQSGAHTRRKVRYLKEQALVSDLYPLATTEITNFGAYISSVNSRVNFDVDRSFFGASLTAKVESNFFDYDESQPDMYSVSGGFELNLFWQRVKNVDYETPLSDSYPVQGGFSLSINKYKISFIDYQEPSRDLYSVQGGFTLNLTITKG